MRDNYPGHKAIPIPLDTRTLSGGAALIIRVASELSAKKALESPKKSTEARQLGEAMLAALQLNHPKHYALFLLAASVYLRQNYSSDEVIAAIEGVDFEAEEKQARDMAINGLLDSDGIPDEIKNGIRAMRAAHEYGPTPNILCNECPSRHECDSYAQDFPGKGESAKAATAPVDPLDQLFGIN